MKTYLVNLYDCDSINCFILWEWACLVKMLICYCKCYMNNTIVSFYALMSLINYCRVFLIFKKLKVSWSRRCLWGIMTDSNLVTSNRHVIMNHNHFFKELWLTQHFSLYSLVWVPLFLFFLYFSLSVYQDTVDAIFFDLRPSCASLLLFLLYKVRTG